MIIFKYVARDYSGQVMEGTTKAASEAEVLDWLRSQECTPVSVDVITINKRKKLAMVNPI